ncbi:MAG: hypothetical protein RLZZ453_853 [Chlamydiota bacterium]|jgi:hypothetical protein
MSHPVFISLINELSICSNASIELEDGLLCIQKGNTPNEWVFSMKVMDVQEEDQEILSCFFSSGLFRFSDKDVLLKWDPKTSSLYAIQHLSLSWKEYLPFRKSLYYFLAAVAEYRSYLAVTPA